MELMRTGAIPLVKVLASDGVRSGDFQFKHKSVQEARFADPNLFACLLSPSLAPPRLLHDLPRLPLPAHIFSDARFITGALC